MHSDPSLLFCSGCAPCSEGSHRSINPIPPLFVWTVPLTAVEQFLISTGVCGIRTRIWQKHLWCQCFGVEWVFANANPLFLPQSDPQVAFHFPSTRLFNPVLKLAVASQPQPATATQNYPNHCAAAEGLGSQTLGQTWQQHPQVC